MSSRKVSVDMMAKAVEQELSSWTEDISEGVKQDVKSVAKETVQQIKTTAPKGSRGKYSKGWTDKVTFEDRENIRVTVHNRTDYQLAHLLEFGHAIVRGGRVIGHASARPHIRPAEQMAEQKLVNKVIVRVRKG